MFPPQQPSGGSLPHFCGPGPPPPSPTGGGGPASDPGPVPPSGSIPLQEMGYLPLGSLPGVGPQAYLLLIESQPHCRLLELQS